MATRTCEAEGCDRKHRSKGFCDLHYRHAKGCVVDGCTKPYKASSMCWSHYMAERRSPYGLEGIEDNGQCQHTDCTTTPMGGGLWCYWHWRKKVDAREVHGIVKCGTQRGRNRHMKLGEPMCTECEYAVKDWLEIMAGAA